MAALDAELDSSQGALGGLSRQPCAPAHHSRRQPTKPRQGALRPSAGAEQWKLHDTVQMESYRS